MFPGTQQIPVEFSGGLNSKVSSFKLQQPYLDTADNVRYNLQGQIDKRPGFTGISRNIQGGGLLDVGFEITTFRDELIVFDGESIYAYSQEEDVWINRGSAFSTINEQYRIINTKVATQSNPDATTFGQYTIYAYEDNRTTPVNGGGVRYTVQNNLTSTFIVSDVQLYLFGTRPKTITDGIDFYVLFNASNNTITYATIPCDRPNTVTHNLVPYIFNGVSTDSAIGSIPYDALIDDGYLMIAYPTASGLTVLCDGYSVIPTSRTNIQAIGMAHDASNNVWIVYSDYANTYFTCVQRNGPDYDEIYPETLLYQYPSVNIAVGLGLESTMNVTLELLQQEQNNDENLVNNFTIGFRGNVAYVGQIRGVGIASKPFIHNNNVFINVICPQSLQATYYTVCLTQGSGFENATATQQANPNAAFAVGFNIVAKHAFQNGGTLRTNSIVAQCDAFNGGFLFAGQRKGPFTSFDNAQTVNLGIAGYSIQFNTNNSFNNVTSNNNLHIVGGVKKVYDGVSCVEDNFHNFPQLPDGYSCDITLQAGGNLTYNPLFGTNQYQWCAIYTWTDNFGQVQRSGVGVVNTVATTASGQGAYITVPTLRLTDKINPRSPVSIEIYRTQVNLPIFYKITNDNAPLVNDTLVDTLTFVDNYSDEQIASNENLYTGTQLSNTAPPACSLISLFQNRIVVNQNEDTNVISYSQDKFEQDQYNTLALDFNTSFVEGIDSKLGDGITAIGLMDTNLVLFKATSIFLLQGSGPNPLDTVNQFNDAQLLVSDVGCVNQDSLVFVTQTPNSPGGLLFKSQKGIYLLGRDTSLTYIGAPVERYNYLTITSSEIITQYNEVIFTSLEGPILVYNYFFNAWSTWSNFPTCVSSTIWQDRLCLLLANGTVVLHDNTNTIYNDTFDAEQVHPVQLDIELPFIGTGLQAYACTYNCLLLGQLKGPHTLQVSVAYDFNPSYIESVSIASNVGGSNTWGSNQIWGMTTGVWGSQQFSNYQYQINFQKKRSQGIRLRIQDINPDGNAGLTLNGLVFEVLPVPGGMRIPTSNKAGTKNPSVPQ